MRETKRGVIRALLVTLLVAGVAVRGLAQGVAYYSMQNTNWPPWPTNMFPALNVTSLGGGRYVVDDRAVDYGLVRSFMAEEDDSPPFPGGDGGTGGGGRPPSPAGYPLISGTTNLWIEILKVTNSQAFLRLHNTVSNELYQLQSKTNLVPDNNRFWIPGQIIMATNTNTDFSPVNATPPNQFIRGQHGTNVVSIPAIVAALRPDQGPGSGNNGSFQINVNNGGNAFPGMDVFYRVGGSATPGQDYQALPGVTNVPASSFNGSAFVTIVPFASSNFEFEENIIVTLIPTNDYLISSNNSSATIPLDDNFTNSPFQLAVTNLLNNILHPAGMAYHPLSNWLIMSINSDQFDPSNAFVRIDTNGNVLNWTGISNLTDEIKLAIAQTNEGGFTTGDMYFGTGTNSILAKLSANGTTSNLDWLTLTEEAVSMRLSLHFDDTGIFSNDLIAVTGDFNGTAGGNVWQITSGAGAVLLTNIHNLHLEGVTILPNDTNKYGPWAGKILTGSEEDNNLFTVDTNGNVTAFNLCFGSEDIHIIPTNQDFYVADRDQSVIFKLPRDLLTNFVGDVMITQEGPSSIFIVYWDTNSAAFLQRRIPAPSQLFDTSDFDFEHGTFAPMDIPATAIPQ